MNPLPHLASLFEDLIRGISGALGIRLRRAWYRRRLCYCGSDLTVEPGVYIVGPAHIELGNSVWIDRNVVLISGPPRRSARITAPGVATKNASGKLRIGDSSHLGIGTIIQAHGDVTIGDFFTTSAGVKIYSFSNDPAKCRKGTLDTGDSEPEYILTSVDIGDNVWLGLDVVIIGNRIGSDCFVMPKSVVKTDLPNNTVADGNPAYRIRARFQNVEP